MNSITFQRLLALSGVLVEFDPLEYPVDEAMNARVTFIIVKRTQTTREVAVLFSTQDGSATGWYTVADHSGNVVREPCFLSVSFRTWRLLEQASCVSDICS